MRVKAFLTETGITLTELLVAVGLTGMVALFTAKLMKDQAENEALLRAKADITRAMSVLEMTLKDDYNCQGALGGDAVPTSKSQISYMTKPPNSVARELIKENTDYGSFFTKGIRLTASTVATSMIDVEIDFAIKILNKGLTPATAKHIVTKKFPLLVTLQAGAIYRCNTFLGDAAAPAKEEFCKSLGAAVATWHSGNQKCVLNDVFCPPGQIVDKMTSLGGLICVPVQDRLTLPNLFNMNSRDCRGLPNFRFNIVGGKITITCTL